MNEGFEKLYGTDPTKDIELVRVASGSIRPAGGAVRLYAFCLRIGGRESEHLAWVHGNANVWRGPVLCRVNSACITSEVFGCQRCDCDWQLKRAIDLIQQSCQGIITYHPSDEGRGHGILTKLETFNYIDSGGSPSRAYKHLGLAEDARQYHAAAFILRYFHVPAIILLTNNLHKVSQLESQGITVAGRLPLVYDEHNPQIVQYLVDKAKQTDQEIEFHNIGIDERTIPS